MLCLFLFFKRLARENAGKEGGKMGKRSAWLNWNARLCGQCLDLQTHGVARLSFFYSCHIITFANEKKKSDINVRFSQLILGQILVLCIDCIFILTWAKISCFSLMKVLVWFSSIKTLRDQISRGKGQAKVIKHVVLSIFNWNSISPWIWVIESHLFCTASW